VAIDRRQLILTANVTVYIPSSGNAILLNAIGATFIGTTQSPLGRPIVLSRVQQVRRRAL
jgi:ribose transport system permease protein